MYVTQNSHRDNCDVVYKPGEPLTYTAGQSIFVKTDYIRQFFSETKPVSYTLVTGVSDYSPSTFFTDEQLLQILDNPLIIEWHAQNVCTDHPKLVHLPIGLEDTPEKLEFCQKYEVELKSIPKIDAVYTNFTPDTNPHERNCFNSEVKEKMDFSTYMRTMAGYRYVMCPMGNGLDTHRFWEAQVCGCIPIVRCPKEFLPTYKNVPYISLPGWCYARMGHPALVQKRESVLKMTHPFRSVPLDTIDHSPEARSSS